MDESFWPILQYFRLVAHRPTATTVVVLLAGCLLILIAVRLALKQIKKDEKEEHF